MPEPIMSAADTASQLAERLKARTYRRACFAAARAVRRPDTTLGDNYRALFKKDLEIDRVVRAAVGGAGEVGAWGQPLLDEPQYAGSYLLALRPATILGRLAGLVRVPPRTWVPRETSKTTAGWIAPGKAIPVSKSAFDRATLDVGHLGALVVVTNELLAEASPDAETMFSAMLDAAIIEAEDGALLDPAAVEVPEVSPASLTNACFTVPSSGTDVAEISADISALVAHLAAAEVPFAAPYFILSPANAAALAGMRTVAEGPAFPGLSVSGGVLNGIPAITSSAARDQLVLVDASLLLLADDGLDVVASRAATLEMVDNPVGDSLTPTAAPTMVPMFQANSTALRAIRRLWWTMARSEAVGRISGFTAGATTATTTRKAAA
jgi:hypothetical protein